MKKSQRAILLFALLNLVHLCAIAQSAFDSTSFRKRFSTSRKLNYVFTKIDYTHWGFLNGTFASLNYSRIIPLKAGYGINAEVGVGYGLRNAELKFYHEDNRGHMFEFGLSYTYQWYTSRDVQFPSCVLQTFSSVIGYRYTTKKNWCFGVTIVQPQIQLLTLSDPYFPAKRGSGSVIFYLPNASVRVGYRF
jgi:hypothetical protein